MKKIFLIMAAILLGLSAKTLAEPIQTSNMNIADTLYYSGQFCKFSDLMQRADLNRVLKGGGPYTVFAPSDAALSRVPQDMLMRLSSCNNDAQLNRAMRYHIVPNSLTTQQMATASCIKTTDGRCIPVIPGSNGQQLGTANIVQSIYTPNGVIHVIDNILMPDQQLSLR